ncbi:hypothetical protein MASR1M45_19540 [Candidatus Kapaibacterium sp.]
MKLNWGYNILIAADAIFQNKLRSILTSLGIIFGVASVIAMLAIGSGAEQEILEKMKLLGTNNIIIKPLDKKKMKELAEAEADESSSDAKKDNTEKFSPGLTLGDMNSIRKLVPTVDRVAPELIFEVSAIRKNTKRLVNLVGINRDYLKINNFTISEGNDFSDLSFKKSEDVCLIGSDVSKKLFPTDNPIGEVIKCDEQWFRVIGILSEKKISKENIQNLGIRDFNMDIYIPLGLCLLDLITAQ